MKGPYHDYMPEWYLDVGLKIVQAMVINSIMPYVGVATALIVPKLIQGLDNGFT
jgi:cyanate permease